ncbi:MAG TPA: TonB-dependent receptor [Verrucomicrobiae bacterium]
MNTNASSVPGGGLRHFFLILLLVVFPLVVRAQDENTGAVSGRVVDSWQGSPVAGVTVLVRGTTLGTTTDSAGNYTVGKIPPGNYAIVFSRSGYTKATLGDVRVAAGQKTPADYSLKPEFYEMEAYEAVAEPILDQGANLMLERQNAVVAMDSIGSAQFARTGVSDAAEIVTKISGASIVDGKTAVIRGLSDRYTSATLNGAEIPTADPYRKSAQLDLFPASLIESVSVTKTFTPDQPGSFTGGAIGITTKSFPEKMVTSFSVGVAYNTQAGLNDEFLTYDGGKTDWAAFDDGIRSLPEELENGTVPPPVFGGTTASRLAANARLEALTRAFGSRQLGPVKGTSGLENSFSFSHGDTVQVANRPFGYFVGVTYNRKFNHYSDGINARYSAGLTPKSELKDTRSSEEVSWGSVVNLAYKLAPEHEIGFNFLYNQSAEDVARRQVGQDFTAGFDPDTRLYLNTLHYTERNLRAFQLKGGHDLTESINTKIDWLATLASTSQEEPDLRFFNFFATPDGSGGYSLLLNNNALPEPTNPSRYFRYLEEDNHTLKLDFTHPFDLIAGNTTELKWGAYQTISQRKFSERTYQYNKASSFEAGDPETYPNDFLSDPNIGFNPNGTLKRWLVEGSSSKYDGRQDVNAGYLMTDLAFSEKWHLIGGGRLETTDLSIKGTSAALGSRNAAINEADWLPAAGLIYKVTTNMNFRLNYGKTIARPTYRELAPYRSYDQTGDEIVEGNPNLKRAMVDNYDFRWEWFPKPGEVLSASFFYKDLVDPIEKYLQTLDGGIITFINRKEAQVYGVEFEARKSLDFIDPLLDRFSVGGNFAYIISDVPLSEAELINKRQIDPATPSSRPMYDQSDMILNADISYDNRKSGTSVTLVMNYVSERITIAMGQGPDIYEHPPLSLDLTISQKLTEHMKLKLSAKNLFDPLTKKTMGPEPGDKIYSAYRKGRVFGIALSVDY